MVPPQSPRGARDGLRWFCCGGLEILLKTFTVSVRKLRRNLNLSANTESFHGVLSLNGCGETQNPAELISTGRTSHVPVGHGVYLKNGVVGGLHPVPVTSEGDELPKCAAVKSSFFITLIDVHES